MISKETSQLTAHTNRLIHVLLQRSKRQKQNFWMNDSEQETDMQQCAGGFQWKTSFPFTQKC